MKKTKKLYSTMSGMMWFCVLVIVSAILLFNRWNIKECQQNVFSSLLQDSLVSGTESIVFMLFMVVCAPCSNIYIKVSESEVLMKSFWGTVLTKMPFNKIRDGYLYSYETCQRYYHTEKIKQVVINDWCIFTDKKITEKYKFQFCHTCVLATLSILNPINVCNPRGYGEENDAFLLYLHPILTKDPDMFVSMFGMQAYDTARMLSSIYQGGNRLKGWITINRYVRKLYRQIFDYISPHAIALCMTSKNDWDIIKENIPIDVKPEEMGIIYDNFHDLNKAVSRNISSMHEDIIKKEILLWIVVVGGFVLSQVLTATRIK